MPKTQTTDFTKMPPQSVESEESLLGALLIDKDAMVKVADALLPDDFYKEGNAKIYEAMMDLFEHHEPIDVVSLSARLQEKGALEMVGGRSYLASLANTVPTSAHVVSYAQIVRKKSTLRKLLSATAEITGLAYTSDETLEITLDKSEQLLFSVSERYLKQNFIAIKDVLTETYDRIEELHREKGKLRGIPTGFADLDHLLAGFQKSDLIILAARPSMGKTTLALDIARHVAVKEKIPVGVFSLEMSKEQLVDRMLCAESGVDLWKMRTGNLSDAEDDGDFVKIGEAMGRLSEAPIFIDDSAGSTIMEIRTKARRLHAEHDIGFIVVDYLQLMEGSNTENRVQEVSEISRSLKSIARELNIPVLAVSQLSRAVENRPNKTPQLSDLRESGSIEQDADVVLFVYRKEMYEDDLPAEEKHITELLIKKHRNGPTGMVKAYFDAEKVTFRNLEKHQEAAPPGL